MRIGLEFRQTLRDLAALFPELRAVHQHAAVLHLEQHRHQRLLDLLVHLQQRLVLLQRAVQHVVQLQRDVGVLGGILGRLLECDLVEGDLFRALAGDVLVLDRVHVQVELGAGIHVVSRRARVQHVGLEHGVVAHAVEADAVVQQHVRVVLEVMADLRAVRVLEQRLELRERLLAVELVRCAGVIVGERQVGRVAGLDAERHADDLGLHVIEAGRLGVEGEERRLLKPCKPGGKLLLGRDRLVMALRRVVVLRGSRGGRGGRFRCGRGRGGHGRGAGELAQQRIHFQALVERRERFNVGRLAGELGGLERQLEIAADGRELARQFERLEILAQALADFALDVLGVLDDLVERAVLVQPLGRGLGAHFRNARDVVGAVADEREVVHDLRRQHVELGLDAGAVELRVEHRVDDRDVVVHELGHVLVAGRDHDLHAVLRRALGERADHVVGLDALDAQQRQAECRNRLDQRVDLRAQVVRHGRAVRLVLLEQVVAEGASRRVHDDRDQVRVLLLEELVHHVEDAEHGTGRDAGGGRERRQREERAV